MRAMRLELAVAIAAVGLGCGSVSSNQSQDGAPPVDASGSDGGMADTGTPDTGSTDGGPIDSRACVASPPGLQARWRGDMNTNDDTGVFNGTGHGNLEYTPGRHGSAFLLDGVGALVTADPSDALYPPASFSIEAWINTTATGVYVTVVNKYDCGGSDGCSGSFWGIDVDMNGHVNFALRVTGSPSNVITLVDSLRSVTDGAWHHLVGVRDVSAGQALVYVDGTLAVSRAISGADLGALNNGDGVPDPVTIGAGRQSGVDTYVQYFTGAIDDVAYYTHALTATEVAGLYAAPDGVCP
jgi:hypothetical protein